MFFENKGERTRKVMGTANEYYLHDHTGRELAVWDKSTNTLKMVNLYGAGMVGRVEINGTNYSTYYYVKDHLGSLRRVVEQSGSAYSSVYNYDTYGCVINSTENVEMPYGFTGQEYDDYTALHNFRARFYDSELGIFYAVDPAGQGFAPYAYCGNNPVICVDRDGKWFFEVFTFISSWVSAFETICANGTEIDNGFEFLGYAGASFVTGKISGGLGYGIATSGIPFANTLGLMASSFTNSLGQSIISGRNMLQINFGIGTYDFSSDKVDWVFGNENNASGYLKDVGDFLNAFNFGNDVNAALYVPYQETANAEELVKDKAKEAGIELQENSPYTLTPYEDLKEHWLKVDDTGEFEETIKNTSKYEEPLLGRIITGDGPRYGRAHLATYTLYNKVLNKTMLATYAHYDIFDINKNILWHLIESLFEPTKPVFPDGWELVGK